MYHYSSNLPPNFLLVIVKVKQRQCDDAWVTARRRRFHTNIRSCVLEQNYIWSNSIPTLSNTKLSFTIVKINAKNCSTL